MSAFLIVLLVAAAALHAAWNLLMKQSADRQLLMWPALAVSAVVSLPLVAFRPPISGVWTLVLISSALEAAYYALLMAAYGIGDFSVVYPIARGVAPALLAVWAVVFLGEHPSAGGIAGIALVVAGLFFTGSGTGSTPGAPGIRQRVGAAGAAVAVLLAVLISVYSAIDGAAVKRADATAYTVVLYALTTLMLTPLVLWRHGWRPVARAMRAEPARILAVGVLQALAYMTVLVVYSRGSVSYAGAIREVSIVIAALVGWLYLGEAFGVRRLAGAVVMFGGILLIAVAG